MYNKFKYQSAAESNLVVWEILMCHEQKCCSHNLHFGLRVTVIQNLKKISQLIYYLGPN